MADTCTACPAPVLWRRHVRTGKPALVNRYPVPGGNVVLVGDDEYRVLGKDEMVEMEADSDAADVDRYTLHFASCPNAPKFRR